MPSKSISKFCRKDVINHQRQLKQNASLNQRVDYLEKLNKSLLDLLNKERVSKQIILSRVSYISEFFCTVDLSFLYVTVIKLWHPFFKALEIFIRRF
jgi:hypothetical protein